MSLRIAALFPCESQPELPIFCYFFYVLNNSTIFILFYDSTIFTAIICCLSISTGIAREYLNVRTCWIFGLDLYIFELVADVSCYFAFLTCTSFAAARPRTTGCTASADNYFYFIDKSDIIYLNLDESRHSNGSSAQWDDRHDGVHSAGAVLLLLIPACLPWYVWSFVAKWATANNNPLPFPS